MRLKRIANAVLYIFLILILSFVLPRIIPGSPLSYSQNDTYILNESLPEETFNSFREYYAPDKPVAEQFAIYIQKLLHLDLGYSFYYKLPVITLIKKRLPFTLLLSFLSLLISTAIAVNMGISSSLNNNKSHLKLALMLCIQAIPSFLAAAIIQGLFAYKLKLFPAWGAYTPGMKLFSPEFYGDFVRHMILPLFTLIISEIPGVYILTYNSAQKIKKENYVTMAHYLNIDNKVINKSFILKNIIPEIVGKLNIQIIYAISGSLFVEAIFSYPGIGMLLKSAASSRDYPLMQGLLLLTCFYGLAINIIFEAFVKKDSLKY